MPLPACPRIVAACLFMLAALSSLHAVEPSDYHLLKVNGERIDGNAKVISAGWSSSAVKIGEDTVSMDSILILSNSNGYFRSAPVKSGKHRLAVRRHAGRSLDIYFLTTNYTSFITPPGSVGIGFGGRTDFFYSKNGSDLKASTYENIKADLWDREASRTEIRKFESMKRAQPWMLAGGAAAALLGVNLMRYDKTATVGLGFVTAGSISILGGITFLNNKYHYLLAAIENYDR